MRIVLYLIILVASLCACSHDSKQKASGTIYVSIEPLRFFTEQIAGDKYDVKTLVRQGASPETYEPTAEQLAGLGKCCMFIKVGELGFERTWLKRITKNAPHTIMKNAGDGIKPVMSTNDIPDQHIWMSTQNASLIADNICRYLIEINHKDSMTFKANTEKLKEKIARTDSTIRTIISQKGCKAFIIYHPALTYFARDYMLSQIPIEEEGREPSAAQLKDIVKKGKEMNVKTVFVQCEFPEANASIVAKGTGAEIKSINPLSYKWDEEMVNIARLLK